MRLPAAEHLTRDWHIHRIVPDFVVEDVWALPVGGRAQDFGCLVDLMTSHDAEDEHGRIDFLDSAAARLLWRLRDLLGRLLGLGAITDNAGVHERYSVPGTDRQLTLAERVDEELRATADGIRFSSVPMNALYLLHDEFAAEISNATMHGVMHLSWVSLGEDVYEGRMAVLVKPRGPLGRAYMAAIRPFRHFIVYPALLRYLEKSWPIHARTASGS
ncbi:DUF2867 domain-containing protein [Microbacterium sp.]|uniref:DUF2867 domain-containing protein n=1 Tax=Microbacterium sp. TaxID=51671 RepID=UPI002811C39C|nr:DUF2867 domain-containing protein [Microbacterium sp.]